MYLHCGPLGRLEDAIRSVEVGVGDDFLLYLHRVKRVAIVHAEGICVTLQPSN